MAALSLDDTATALAQAFYANLDSTLKDGITTSGGALDRPGIQDFNDDSKVKEEIRTSVKDSLLLSIAALIKELLNVSPPGASSIPVWAKNTAPSASTSSGTFADISGASVSVTQVIGLQKVVVTFDMSSFASATNLELEVRLVYDGVNKEAFKFFFNNGSEHLTQSFSWVVDGAITTGAKVAKIQWRLASGTGTISMNVDDHFSLIAR